MIEMNKKIKEVSVNMLKHKGIIGLFSILLLGNLSCKHALVKPHEIGRNGKIFRRYIKGGVVLFEHAISKRQQAYLDAIRNMMRKPIEGRSTLAFFESIAC